MPEGNHCRFKCSNVSTVSHQFSRQFDVGSWFHSRYTPSIVVVAARFNRPRLSSLIRLRFQWGDDDPGGFISDPPPRPQLGHRISCSMTLRR
ncbi:hypothetical protein NL676_035458 [Syzygium grande]|nr:hypothetical protein NL676_035458 [Syzygium grande]